MGPPACVMLMSALGIWAYWRAIRAGLQETKCVLKRPVLAMTYLGVAFIAASHRAPNRTNPPLTLPAAFRSMPRLFD